MKYGYYNELDLLQKEYPDATFGFLEIEGKVGKCNAHDFLHGYCLSFAVCLSNRFGYPIETVRNEEGDLIHAYCVDPKNGLYIDVRGITNDPDLFFDEFADEVDYAGGEFWCLHDQAAVDLYRNTRAFMADHPDHDFHHLLEASKLILLHSNYYDSHNPDVLYQLEKENQTMRKWFIEVVQDHDGTYYANMAIDGQPVRDLPQNVDYTTLREAIRNRTGVEILKRKDMQFQQFGHKKYAYLDNTQYRGEGKDCRVSLDEMRAGWQPDFSDTPVKKPSLDAQIHSAQNHYCSAPAAKNKNHSFER